MEHDFSEEVFDLSGQFCSFLAHLALGFQIRYFDRIALGPQRFSLDAFRSLDSCAGTPARPPD